MKWTKAALIRAAKTICQTAVATIGTTVVIEDVDWRVVISASILSGILSILTSIAGLPEAQGDKPELPDDYYEQENGEDE